MNKKSLILLLSIATTFAFATTPNYYDASTNPSVLNVSTTSATSTVLGNITTDYDGTKGNIITLESTPADWKEVYAGNFSKDFTFDNGVIIKNNRTAEKGANSFYFNLSKDAKLTINSYMGYDSGSKTTHYRFKTTDATRGQVEINTNLTLSHNTESQMWLEGVDVVYNGTDATGKFGYTHFSSGATLTATKDLTISHLALRSLGKDIEGNDTYGNLIINKATVTIGSFIINNGTVSGGDYRVEFANANSAEALVIKGVNTLAKFNDQNIALEFIDFGKDDKIYSAVDLTTFNNVTVNGTALSTLLADDTINVNAGSYDGTNYSYVYSLVAVPEPATYALIFGALALSFVAYRRRK